MKENNKAKAVKFHVTAENKFNLLRVVVSKLSLKVTYRTENSVQGNTSVRHPKHKDANGTNVKGLCLRTPASLSRSRREISGNCALSVSKNTVRCATKTRQTGAGPFCSKSCGTTQVDTPEDLAAFCRTANYHRKLSAWCPCAVQDTFSLKHQGGLRTSLEIHLKREDAFYWSGLFKSAALTSQSASFSTQLK